MARWASTHAPIFVFVDAIDGQACSPGATNRTAFGPQVFLVEQVADLRMTKVALRVVSVPVAGVKVRMRGGPLLARVP
jgi:hypothetical protein